MDLAEVVDSHQPRRVSVLLCPDNDLAERYAEAQAELEQVVKQSRSLSSDGVQQARSLVRDLEAQVADVSIEFVLQSIGRSRWTKLRDKHQPTKAQREQWRQQGQVLDHNPDTFPQAAIAASLVEPKGSSDAETAKLVQRMWDEWNFGECERLWRACVEANVGAMSVPKRSTASVTTPDIGQRSERQSSSESPDQSSTDGGSLAG